MNATRTLVPRPSPRAVDAALSEEWDDLAERIAGSPYLHPGWIEAWWRAFGPRRAGLDVVTVRRGGSLVGLLPVVRRGAATSSPTNWHSFAFGSLCLDGEAAGQLAERLLGERSRRISLGFMEDDDPLASALRAAAPLHRRGVVERPLQRSPFLSPDGSWSRFEAGLSRNLRGQLRRTRNGLDRLGEVRYCVEDGTSGLEASLEAGFRLEAMGWKGRRGTAIASRPDTHGFYTEVARWAAGRGWLRLSFIRLNGRPIAFELCFERDGVHSCMKTGFDPDLHRFGPGTVIAFEGIRRAFEVGLRRYDLMGEATPWKLRWTSHCRERLLIQSFAPTPLGVAGWAAAAHVRPVARRIVRALRGGSGER